MSCCHECVAEPDQDSSEIVYQGSSPDEIVIVSTAAKMGFAFKRVENGVIHLEVQGREESYQLLYLF